jgi:cephalosporin hydroxylase
MPRKFFWETGGCDESHRIWGSQGIEVACKAWLSGGALKVNKKTWFAHYFRGHVGFPYPLSGRAVDHARKYSKDLWLNNKWPQAVRPFQFMLDKFNPPGWENDMSVARLPEEKLIELQTINYKHVHLSGNDPRWRGLKMIKLPSDIVLYQMAIWEKQPDFLVEIGTAFGASAMMFADFMDMVGKGHVISIDPSPRGPLQEHPRITYLKGDSKSEEIVAKVRELVGDGSVMLSIDGNHARAQVKWELYKYRNIVTPGQYCVVEDCYGRHSELVGPGEARDWFMANHGRGRYVQTHFDARFLVGFTKGGWLMRK